VSRTRSRMQSGVVLPEEVPVGREDRDRRTWGSALFTLRQRPALRDDALVDRPPSWPLRQPPEWLRLGVQWRLIAPVLMFAQAASLAVSAQACAGRGFHARRW
jgi:hypothetical protein